MTCPHHLWSPTFWDGSRYCETCELVEQDASRAWGRSPEAREWAAAPDAKPEASEKVEEIRDARARPLTDEELASMRRRIGWACARSFGDDEVRRLITRLDKAEASVAEQPDRELVVVRGASALGMAWALEEAAELVEEADEGASLEGMASAIRELKAKWGAA